MVDVLKLIRQYFKDNKLPDEVELYLEEEQEYIAKALENAHMKEKQKGFLKELQERSLALARILKENFPFMKLFEFSFKHFAANEERMKEINAILQWDPLKRKKNPKEP